MQDAHFIYHYTTTSSDKFMQWFERGSINQEYKYLIENGANVDIIEQGTARDIKKAFYDPEAQLIVLSGHGYEDGGLLSYDRRKLTPANFDKRKISKALKVLVLESCYQGEHIDEWKSILPEGTEVIGWTGTTTPIETRSYNGKGWFDRQKGHTLQDQVEKVDLER